MVSLLNNVLSDETKRSRHASKHGAAALARADPIQPAWRPGKLGYHSLTPATPAGGTRSAALTRVGPPGPQERPGKPGHPVYPATRP